MSDVELERAAMLWRAKKSVEAGKVLFERVPPELRPAWAARVLRLVIALSGARFPAVEPTLAMADDPSRWERAHDDFSRVRTETLRLEKLQRTRALTDAEKQEEWVLAFAELVAKVTYNATDPGDPFDEDSGWWIAAHVKSCVERLWPDDAFAGAAWSALCSREA